MSESEGRVEQPPGVDASSSTITVRVNEERMQSSPVHIINGLPWRLVVTREAGVYHSVALHCDAAAEYELWRADAAVRLRASVPKIHGYRTMTGRDSLKKYPQKSHMFASWIEGGSAWNLSPSGFEPNVGPFSALSLVGPNATEVSVEIVVQRDPVRFTRRPMIDFRSSFHDVTLVIDGQKFPVNMEVLAAQSAYFNSIFVCCKESNIKEIELRDTNPEDFNEVLKMLFGFPTNSITAENVQRYLRTADMFELKIVKDRLENFLLSTTCVSDEDKLLFADQYGLEILKDPFLPRPPFSDHTYALPGMN